MQRIVRQINLDVAQYAAIMPRLFARTDNNEPLRIEFAVGGILVAGDDSRAVIARVLTYQNRGAGHGVPFSFAEFPSLCDRIGVQCQGDDLTLYACGRVIELIEPAMRIVPRRPYDSRCRAFQRSGAAGEEGAALIDQAVGLAQTVQHLVEPESLVQAGQLLAGRPHL